MAEPTKESKYSNLQELKASAKKLSGEIKSFLDDFNNHSGEVNSSLMINLLPVLVNISILGIIFHRMTEEEKFFGLNGKIKAILSIKDQMGKDTKEVIDLVKGGMLPDQMIEFLNKYDDSIYESYLFNKAKEFAIQAKAGDVDGLLSSLTKNFNETISDSAINCGDPDCDVCNPPPGEDDIKGESIH